MIASIVFVHNVWFFTAMFFLNTIFNKLDITDCVSTKDKIYFNLAICSYVQLSTSTSIYGICIVLVIRGLNTTLKNFLDYPVNHRSCDVIRMSSLIYIKVCEICDNCSIIYSLLLTPFLMVFLFYNLLLTYGIFVYQMNANNQLYWFSLLALIFVVLYAPTVFILFSMSNFILTKSKTTIDLVQQIISKQKDARLQKKCNNLILLLSHTKPVWSLTLFDIHWKSFFGMLGVIFSYSVILVQFYDVSND